MGIDPTLALVVIFCFLTGCTVGNFANSVRKKATESRHSGMCRTSFLFEDDELIDATRPARQLLVGLEAFGTEKENLISLCGDQYPDLKTAWDNLSEMDCQKLQDQETGVCDLEIAAVGRRVSIKILDGPEYRGSTILEDLLASRVRYLSDVLRLSPYLIWRERKTGGLIWSNKKYENYIRELDGAEDTKAKVLTETRLFPNLPTPASDDEFATETRQSILDRKKNEEHWFNIVSFPTADGSLHFGSDANEFIAADRAQKSTLRTFVQIFAQLSIGFAIFDESRQLQTYNPSLAQLTGLDPMFLSSKPTLVRILDEMRQNDRTPEPKDYADFRQTIRDLEQAASNGTFEDVWTLADGQSLRVTGRPYQNGSLAFLIEDISSELTLTRKYRTEVLAYQELADVVETPVYLFSGSGILITRNKAAERLLAADTFNQGQSFSELLRYISQKAVPCQASLELEKNMSTRSKTTCRLHLFNGQGLHIKKESLSNGFFAVTIQPTRRDRSQLPSIVQRRTHRELQ